ncbi:La domain-containing protein 1 [Elsinoe fawcettii]|nr:La domain-containing protein 1 [Elsinoe fawcettii]
MSEADKEPTVAAEQVEANEVESKETGARPVEEKSDSATEQAPAETEPEVKETTETNGKSGEKRNRDDIDEKIDRYARDSKRPFQQKRGKQIKSNFENLPETDDAEEIRRQVEFYFSDANLHQDAFLLKETGGSKNEPFPLKQLHTFKRMKRFQPYSAVVAAVKESKVLEINDKDEITRKTPLSADYDPEDTRENKRIYEEKSMARSIYAKGFGEETETTQTDIEEFFAPYGDISAVRLRRQQYGEFKGSVLVEFADEETAKSFLELDPKPKWQGKHELKFSTKKEWAAEKAKEAEDRPPRRDYDRRDNRKSFDRRGGRDDRRGKFDRRGNKGRDDRRRDRSRDRSRSPRRRDDDEEDWRDRRDRDRDNKGKGRNGRRDDRRSKRDKDDDNHEEKSDKKEKREATPDSGDEVAKLAGSKKRSRDDAEGGAEPEAKKVKEDESQVKTDKAPEEVSAAA